MVLWYCGNKVLWYYSTVVIKYCSNKQQQATRLTKLGTVSKVFLDIEISSGPDKQQPLLYLVNRFSRDRNAREGPINYSHEALMRKKINLLDPRYPNGMSKGPQARFELPWQPIRHLLLPLGEYGGDQPLPTGLAFVNAKMRA